MEESRLKVKWWRDGYKKGYTKASTNIKSYVETCELLHNQEEFLEDLGLSERLWKCPVCGDSYKEEDRQAHINEEITELKEALRILEGIEQ